MVVYLPKQKDVVWIDFNPQKDREIQKYRPALVLSSNNYNTHTGFVIVAPITSTIRDKAGYYTLGPSYETHGQVNASQIYSLDASEAANRKIKYIETLRDEDFYRVAQIVYYNFNFPF